MKLSVITINYNNLDGLKQTAESIINQTWKDFEWIIIDGGSTDGSREYIVNINENLNQKGWNPISYWCSESDKGIYNALNKGIFHCNGEFISCMNSGDSFFD
jgi:glycosyltransferase involved in cell wall biosynthesis